MQNKFLIVERHPLFAEALASCIEGAIIGAFIEHARTVTEAKAAIYREKGFNLVFLDLSLPDTHGLDGLIELRQQFPDVPIVIISPMTDRSLVRTAIVCGAVGFIPKSASKHVIQRIITDVLASDVVSPDNFSAELDGDTELATWRGGRPEPLTEKQLRVLQMLCSGLYNKQIAYKLDVQTTTVKSHITEILRKLHVDSPNASGDRGVEAELGRPHRYRKLRKVSHGGSNLTFPNEGTSCGREVTQPPPAHPIPGGSQHPCKSDLQRPLGLPRRRVGAHRTGGHSQEGQGAKERQSVLHDFSDFHERAIGKSFTRQAAAFLASDLQFAPY